MNIKFLLLAISIILTTSFLSSNDDKHTININNFLLNKGFKIEKPVFADSVNNDSKKYTEQDILDHQHYNFDDIFPISDQTASWGEKWQNFNTLNKKLTLINENHIFYAVFYLEPNRWIEGEISLKSNIKFNIYLNDELLGTSNAKADKFDFSKKIKLLKRKHKIRIKFYSDKEIQPVIETKLTFDKKFGDNPIELSLSPKRNMNILDIMDGEKVGNASISYDGKYALISYSENITPEDSESHYEIKDISEDKILPLLPNKGMSAVKWLPASSKLSYKMKEGKGHSIYIIDIESGEKIKVLNQIEDLGNYEWAENESKFIYEISHSPKNSDDILKRYQELEDRHPWWRNRNYLFEYDMNNEISRRLTWGYLSSTLQDVSITGKYVLFSTERPQYNTRQYAYQNMYLLNTETMEVKSLWEDKTFPCSATISPDEQKLLVLGGPTAFGEIGENIPDGMIANNYDTQAYLYDIATANVDPITKDFDPKILTAHWSLYDNKIYFLAQNKTFNDIFAYEIDTKSFDKIETDYDYISSFSFANNTPDFIFKAEGMQQPELIAYKNLESIDQNIIANPEKMNYQNVEFGNTDDWDYVTENNDTIMGRIYYPPGFDDTKKYPLIVYYYGGTNPVSRSFGGRYPFNIFAAQGYVVYVLQPSGATGFGQEFSARHVNNWGITVADEIINGTKYFLEENQFCDESKVGCIGASYGGFMTMLLQTRTDIFAAAISHAGISSISSYWGEGYWGYLYSSEASANSFPWNNPDLYINQSPLFQADKVVNPIMLLHGDVDTNVPVGESIQFFTALKLLGKPVELVTIKDTDHHVVKYQHRIEWNNAIFAYFDKWLKDQPEWWNNMFPEAKY